MQLRAFLLPAALFALTAMQAQNLEIVNDSVAVPPDPDRYHRSIYVNLGVGLTNLGIKNGYRNMMQLLENQNIGFLIIKNTQYAMGFGGRIRRWYLDVDIQLPPSQVYLKYSSEYLDNSITYLNAESDYFNVGLNLGYAFLQNRNDVWVVRGGLGLSEYFIRITEGSPTNSFDFNNITGSSSWRTWPTFYHASAAGNVSVEWQRGGRAKRGISLAPGFIAGYQFGLGQPRWKLLNLPAFNGPADRAGFAYFGLNFKIARNFESKPKN
jgi:hypothetical protein